jgi:hypothetical protein
MSNEAYNRSISRESKVWVPFSLTFPFSSDQTGDRVIIFGLYANSYLNNHKYLIEVEATDLLNLLTDYNSKISDLTTQEQIVIATIVSKRYLAGIEKQIHDEKMITESQKITADDLMWDAKIAALAADTAAIDTMIAKVNSETQKTAARISELEAYIEIESYNLSNVDIEIAEKELQSSKVDLEVLNAANSVLKIQADTVAKATELIDIDLRIAGIKREIASTERNIAEIDLLADDLIIARAKTVMDQAELPVFSARKDLAAVKSGAMDDEIAYVEGELTYRETESHRQKRELVDYRYATKTEELVRSHEKNIANLDQQLDLSNLDVTFANSDVNEQASIDQDKINELGGRLINARNKVNSAIAIATTMAGANIVSTLTHTIGKASAE